jgi:hypothetical protein
MQYQTQRRGSRQQELEVTGCEARSPSFRYDGPALGFKHDEPQEHPPWLPSVETYLRMWLRSPSHSHALLPAGVSAPIALVPWFLAFFAASRAPGTS